MSTNLTFKNVVYSIPTLEGENGWATTLSTYLAALAAGAAVNSTAKQSIRVATASPVIVSSTTDYCVLSNLAVAGPVDVTLPTGVAGQIFVVCDGKGDAATNNITIQGTGGQQINGASSLVVAVDRAGVALQFDGSEWRVTSSFLGKFPTGRALVSDASGRVAAATSLMVTASEVLVSSVFRRGASTANSTEEEYQHSIALLAGQTNTAIASLTFAHATFFAIKVEYTLREAGTNNSRLGTISVVTNGTTVSIIDEATSLDCDSVEFSAAVVGANVEVRYSSGGTAHTLRADVQRFRA